MCFQFDVYRNPSDRTREYQPYFMIIQHDFYDDLATPLVNIEFQTYFLNTANITHVETKKLNNKNYVCNLRSARSSVLAGIDALITNT